MILFQEHIRGGKTLRLQTESNSIGGFRCFREPDVEVEAQIRIFPALQRIIGVEPAFKRQTQAGRTVRTAVLVDGYSSGRGYDPVPPGIFMEIDGDFRSAGIEILKDSRTRCST